MEEVRGVIDSESVEGHDTLPLEGLGLRGAAGDKSRLVVFVRAPEGPYLRFCGDIGFEEIGEDDVLYLPPRPFSGSAFSAVVLHEGEVMGLMLNAHQVLQYGQKSPAV